MDNNHTTENKCLNCGRNLSQVFGSAPPVYWKHQCEKYPEAKPRKEKKLGIEKEQIFKGNLSLKNYAFRNQQNTKRRLSREMLIRIGDEFMKLTRIKQTREIAEKLGYKVKMRFEISDRARRKMPKCQIGRYVYYLTIDKTKTL